MKHQNGNTALVVLIVLIVGMMMLGTAAFMKYRGAYTYAIGIENQYVAEIKKAKTEYASFETAVRDIANASKLNAKQTQDLQEAANKFRYGEGGSKAMMNWIQENNIPFDASINKQLARKMEAGRAEIKTTMYNIEDLRRSYKTKLDDKMPIVGDGWWIAMHGYPKVDLDEFKLLSSETAEETFETGKMDSISIM